MYISIQHAYTPYKNSICIITSVSYREPSHSRRVEGGKEQARPDVGARNTNPPNTPYGGNGRVLVLTTAVEKPVGVRPKLPHSGVHRHIGGLSYCSPQQRTVCAHTEGRKAMHDKRINRYFRFAITCFTLAYLTAATEAHAQAMPWENPLLQLLASLQGPTAQAIIIGPSLVALSGWPSLVPLWYRATLDLTDSPA